MPKCPLGMQKNVQGHRIASVCKQTYDASCNTLRGRRMPNQLQQLECKVVLIETSHAYGRKRIGGGTYIYIHLYQAPPRK